MKPEECAMSFVTTVPDLIETAAGDLAGIRSSLGAATAAAAPSTTGVATAAADEVSVAIAALFDTHGEQFQSLSTQAEAFHSEFVRLLNSASASYVSTEANVRQGLLSAVSGSTRETGAAFGAIAASGTGDIAGPYQQLFANTSANLEALGSELQANPTPLLRQFLANQRGYAQTIAAEFQSAIQGFPGNVRPAIQAFIQSLENFDLAAFLQTFVQHQIGYAQTIGTALQNAAMDFGTGLRALPASFQSAFQALQTGDVSGAVNDITSGFVNLFVTGVDVQSTGPITAVVATITPEGTVGSLLPILNVPVEMAQNFTNFLPPGSIPAQISQNFTNVLATGLDTSLVANAGVFIRIIPPQVGFTASVFSGVPVTILLGAVGAPVNAFSALGTSVTAFTDAVQTGNAAGAIGALIDAPAVVTNGLLNGHMYLPINFDISGYPTTIDLPLDGLLVPPSPYPATISVTIGPLVINVTSQVGGTPFGGLIPALLTDIPEEFAEAIGKIPPTG
jgi:hypothetical protein